MATSALLLDPPIPTDVRCEGGRLVVDLDDGRMIALPLDWYPRLNESSEDERRTWELVAGGEGIHWPDIDEHLSVEQLILGIKAPREGIWPGEPRKSERT